MHPRTALLYKRIIHSLELLSSPTAPSNATISQPELASRSAYYYNWSREQLYSTSEDNSEQTLAGVIRGEEARKWILSKYDITDTLPPLPSP